MAYGSSWDALVTPSGGGGALSGGAFSTLGSAASDIFSGIAEGYKAEGEKLQAKQYTEASQFATLEAQIQHSTTAINTAQATRQGYQGIGRAQASVAGAGFGAGGSGGDILRSSAQQAALQASVATQTGQVAELGFEQQAKSYQDMAKASEIAAKADEAAQTGSYISGGLKIAGTIAMMA